METIVQNITQLLAINDARPGAQVWVSDENQTYTACPPGTPGALAGRNCGWTSGEGTTQGGIDETVLFLPKTPATFDESSFGWDELDGATSGLALNDTLLLTVTSPNGGKPGRYVVTSIGATFSAILDPAFTVREGATVRVLRSTGAPTYRQTAATGSGTAVFVPILKPQTLASFSPLDTRVWNSPGNTTDDGVGNLLLVFCGAKSRVDGYGASCTWSVTVAALVAAAVAANDYPFVRVGVDGVYGAPFQLTSASTTVAASASANSWHTFELEFVGSTDAIDNYQTPVNVVKVTSISVADIRAPYVRPIIIEWRGDSITKGTNILGSSAKAADSVSYLAYPRLVSDALNAECVQTAIGGVGMGRAASSGNRPAYIYSGDYYYQGKPRLVQGSIKNPPSIVFINHGTNDLAGTDVTADFQARMARERALLGSSVEIFWIIPVAGSHRAHITAAYLAYLESTASSPDLKTYLLDLGAAFTPDYSDGVHPSATGQQQIATALLAAIPYARISSGITLFLTTNDASSVTVVGSKVSRWTSKVGTAYAEQTTDANRPTLGLTDGKPSIKGAAGSSTVLTFNAKQAGGDATSIYIVGACRTAMSGSTECLATLGDTVVYAPCAGMSGWTIFNGAQRNTAKAIDAHLHIMSQIITTVANLDTYTDAGQKVTFTNGTSWPSRATNSLLGDGGTYSSGDLAAIIVVNHKQPLAEVMRTHAYLESEWAITPTA